jgi:hypothetical protein
MQSINPASINRAHYFGSEVEGITGWNDLDYIGVDAFYPLNTNDSHQAVCETADLTNY